MPNCFSISVLPANRVTKTRIWWRPVAPENAVWTSCGMQGPSCSSGENATLTACALSSQPQMTSKAENAALAHVVLGLAVRRKDILEEKGNAACIMRSICASSAQSDVFFQIRNLRYVSGRTYSASICAHAPLQHSSLSAPIGPTSGELPAGGSRLHLHSRSEHALDAPSVGQTIGPPARCCSGAGAHRCRSSRALAEAAG